MRHFLKKALSSAKEKISGKYEYIIQVTDHKIKEQGVEDYIVIAQNGNHSIQNNEVITSAMIDLLESRISN